MAPTARTRRRTPDGRTGRVGLRVTPGAALMAFAAIVVAGLSARDTAVFVLKGSQPDLAVRLAPANATAIVNLFDREIVSGEWQNDRAGWLYAATRALRSDPLSVKGLRLVGYVTEIMPGGQARASKIMQLSERVSRRDILGQLWLIEDAVRRENVGEALQHYDRALSVRPASAGQLLPVLASAITDVPIQKALVPYLRANRPWAAPFLSVAVSTTPDPATAAALFRRYGGARVVPAHAEYERRLLNRMVRTGRLQDATRFSRWVGAAPEAFAFGFSKASTDERFHPLTWTLYQGPDGDAVLSDRGALSLEVRGEKMIVAATRVIATGPGSYTLVQRVSFPDPAAAPLVSWEAYCRRERGPERFWVRDVPVGAGPIRLETTLTAPDDCTGVQMDLKLTGGAGMAKSNVTIDQVSLFEH